MHTIWYEEDIPVDTTDTGILRSEIKEILVYGSGSFH